MSKKLRILLGCGLVVALIALAALIGFLGGRAAPPTPLPNPNGYDEFLKAGGLVAGDAANYARLATNELREFVQTNAEPLRLVRLGLTRACSFPTDSAMTNFDSALSDLGNLKRLVQLLVAEGRLAELESRPADAARGYLDAIRFGNEISRGGFMINRLVGVACETIGGSPLARLAPGLNCDQSRTVIAELEKLDSEAVTWNEILRNENRFRRQRGVSFLNPMNWIGIWLARPAIKRGEEKHDRIAARLRLLIVELALRCYRTKHSHGPGQLEQLVPGHLKRLPLDPFSGRPLIYRASGTNWLLYSVGPDGVDDGGKPAGGSVTNKGDLVYGSGW